MPCEEDIEWLHKIKGKVRTYLPPTLVENSIPPHLSVIMAMPQAEGAAVNDFRQERATEEFLVEVGQDENSSTFIFGNEDHTFGNPLRHILMQNPDTDFCGYSVPHPYEPRLNLRLQTNGERSSMDVLSSGLTELESLCNIMESKFNNALEEFQNVDKTSPSKSKKTKR